jgi:IclR family transcriptional regulator, acetate operon repressor
MAGVQSIERAFSILRVLARGHVGVTEIAERTDLPKSTVSRILAALESEGAVQQAEAGGGYAVGPALAMLGGAVNPSASLRSVVRPFIEELAAATGGSAGFTVLDGRDVYWVDNVDDGDELVTLADQTGQSFPLHTVPTGLALLSKFEPSAVDEYLAEPLVALHDRSIVDSTVLRPLLERYARDEVVVSLEQIDAGINAFAAPFRGPDRSWIGALYVQGPSFRFPGDGNEARVAMLVSESAVELSGRLRDR